MPTLPKDLYSLYSWIWPEALNFHMILTCCPRIAYSACSVLYSKVCLSSVTAAVCWSSVSASMFTFIVQRSQPVGMGTFLLTVRCSALSYPLRHEPQPTILPKINIQAWSPFLHPLSTKQTYRARLLKRAMHENVNFSQAFNSRVFFESS